MLSSATRYSAVDHIPVALRLGENTTGRHLRSFSNGLSNLCYSIISCNPRVFPELMAMVGNVRGGGGGLQKYNENGCNNNKTAAIRNVMARIKML